MLKTSIFVDNLVEALKLAQASVFLTFNGKRYAVSHAVRRIALARTYCRYWR